MDAIYLQKPSPRPRDESKYTLSMTLQSGTLNFNNTNLFCRSREANREKAKKLMCMGNHKESMNILRRALDISHEMALDLIKVCQQQNIDCIVAPYEADSQLAYLNIKGIVDCVITEDSDLSLFGCTNVSK